MTSVVLVSQAFKDSDNYNGKEIANMRSANLIFSISKVRADSVQYIRHAAGSWSVIVETQRGCVHQVLKRRARACFESTPCTRAEMIRALRNAVDWSLQATTRCTAKTLEYCNNAWVEPTLRMGKHGPLSLLASFGDLEVYLPMRCSHFFPLWECLNVVFGMNRSCCAASRTGSRREQCAYHGIAHHAHPTVV